jgi:hypothetical protein
MMGDEELRIALDEAMKICLPGEFENAWKHILQMVGHRLRIVDATIDTTYNCHAHGLGLERLPAYQALFADRGGRFLATSLFMLKLIQDGELQIVAGLAYGPKNVILYFNGEHLTHTARVAEANELLLSKWGPSELIEHRLWEVPEGYGDTYKVAVPPPPERSMELLIEWLPRIA